MSDAPLPPPTAQPTPGAPVPPASTPTRPSPTPADPTVQEAGDLVDLLHGALRRIRRGPSCDGPSGPGEAVPPGQFRMLRVLAGRPTPLRLGEVAGLLDVAPRSATAKVDAAERDGLVRRLPDPSDRRATLVELTEAGRRAVETVGRDRADRARELLAVLDPHERTQLLRLLARIDTDH